MNSQAPLICTGTAKRALVLDIVQMNYARPELQNLLDIARKPGKDGHQETLEACGLLS